MYSTGSSMHHQHANHHHHNPHNSHPNHRNSSSYGLSSSDNIPRTYREQSYVQDEQIAYFLQAVCSNDVKLVNEIVKSTNVPIDITDNTGFNALMYASMNGYLNIVRKLIELGANVDQQHYRSKDTSLHYAAQCGHTRTVEILIKYGNANREVLNHKSKTPYQIAKDFGHGNNKIMKDFLDLSVNGDCSDSGNENNNSSSTRNNNNNNNTNQSFDNGRDTSSLSQQSTGTNGAGGGTNNNNRSSKPTINSKDESLLPNKILLEILNQTGIYSVQGMGFSMLAQHNPKPFLMLTEVAQNLQIENDPDELLLQMIKIYDDFEQKDPLVSAGDLMLYSLMSQQQQSQNNDNNNSNQNNGRYHHHNHHNNNNHHNNSNFQIVENSKFANIRHYLQWKQSNRDQIGQLIELLKYFLSKAASSSSSAESSSLSPTTTTTTQSKSQSTNPNFR